MAIFQLFSELLSSSITSDSLLPRPPLLQHALRCPAGLHHPGPGKAPPQLHLLHAEPDGDGGDSVLLLVLILHLLSPRVWHDGRLRQGDQLQHAPPPLDGNVGILEIFIILHLLSPLTLTALE